MEITSSYKVDIRKTEYKYAIRDTRDYYRKAVDYLVVRIDEVWDDIIAVPVAKNERKNFIEHLFHKTKENPSPVYHDFDSLFPGMPSYFRRSALSAAYGHVSSYRSNYENWVKDGRVGNPPVLPERTNAAPVFYRDNSYIKSKDPDCVYLKLYVDNTWKFVSIPLCHTDMNYINKHWTGKKENCPALMYSHGKWQLCFSFTEQVILPVEVPINERIVCQVDLGVNTDATCSIMKSDGTVLARKFINFGSDKDRLYRVLNRIKKFQRENGPRYSTGLWHYAKALNKHLADRIADAIVTFASENRADVIVFEHLDIKKKAKGSKKQKIAMWRKNGIQKTAEHKAHRLGIRISRVCAWNTSKLAFDGSGEVTRDKSNYSLCTFTTGKRYNCDLSASYNIGARYFIRELFKPLSATEESELTAKVPESQRRTSCTLDTLKKLNAALAA